MLWSVRAYTGDLLLLLVSCFLATVYSLTILEIEWPMTLAPMYEDIKRETSGKPKFFLGKKLLILGLWTRV